MQKNFKFIFKLMCMNFFVYNSVKIKKYFLLFCKMSDGLITGKKIQEKLKHYLNLDVSESRCLYYRLRSRSRSGSRSRSRSR
jgi:hypothetical protein